MNLGIGIILGPYELLSPLGAGGMGEVYRARDTRLSREVAVKILPVSFANDADRLLRYVQSFRKFKGRTSGVDYGSLAPPDTPDEYDYIAKRVSHIPIWIFHGDADQTVSAEESRKMLAALKAIGADVRYTELPGVPHNVWDPAYARATEETLTRALLAER